MTGRLTAPIALCCLALCAALLAMAPAPTPSPTTTTCAETKPCERRGVLAMALPAIGPKVSEVHRQMVQRIIDQGPADGAGVATCFVDGTDDETIAAFNAAVALRDGDRFNQTTRWGATALGPAGAQGDPVVLTYSFVPDGTPIPAGVGEPAGVSNLFAFLNGIYGSPAVWQPLYQQIFDRWSQLSGITYVYEPNDDGAAMFNSPGVAGVRGDLRMGGKLIDGNSGILAYNFFPQGGDMVIDTADSFYATTTSNSLRLRNILAHEHGHGMGQAHVCPISTTKLMEPTIATNYDGPRHDDIRNAQRHYGDPFEPDNSPAEATNLGTLAEGSTTILGPTPAPPIAFGSVLSIDSGTEQDYFLVNIAATQRINVTVTPIGLLYDDADQACSGQPASCCAGVFSNSQAAVNLGIQVIDSDGSTVLATASAEPAGSIESLIEVLLPAAGDYYIRVYATDAVSNAQLYHISIQITPSFLGPRFTLPNGAPTLIPAGVATTFSVNLNPNDDTLVSPPSLLVRLNGGAYQSIALSPVAGNLYTASIPAPLCTSTPEFYLQAQGTTTGTTTLPAGGAASPFAAFVGTDVELVSFNFETAPGWTVFNDGTLTDGGWDRGVPVICGRGDPFADFDGSGQCFLTDNSAAASCNSDVDGGSTTLTSPVFDLTSLPDPYVSYARWYSNTFGGAPQADIFVVEVSSNAGASWVNLETVGPTGASPNPQVDGSWFYKSFRISDFVPVTSQFQVRFTASDLATGSVVEAGVDAVRINGLTCSFTPPNCPGDADGNGVVNFDDITSVLANWLADYSPGTGPGDADASGIVNFDDITSVLANWLNTCP